MTPLIHSTAASSRSDRAGDGEILPPSPATNLKSVRRANADPSSPTGCEADANPALLQLWTPFRGEKARIW